MTIKLIRSTSQNGMLMLYKAKNSINIIQNFFEKGALAPLAPPHGSAPGY